MKAVCSAGSDASFEKHRVACLQCGELISDRGFVQLTQSLQVHSARKTLFSTRLNIKYVVTVQSSTSISP